MTVMTAVMRRHKAAMIERNGRSVAGHFTAPNTEAAVCRSHVGLAERSDRSTLDLFGPSQDVDAALESLAPFGERVRWLRRPGRAVIECAERDAEACVSAMLASSGEVDVSDASDVWVALDLIGPRAGDVLKAAEIEDGGGPVLVMSDHAEHVELLAPAAHGPWLWNHLLNEGAAFGILPVGREALELLEVADRLRRP
jgi:glycine cleavage system aminomethyltransferase T